MFHVFGAETIIDVYMLDLRFCSVTFNSMQCQVVYHEALVMMPDAFIFVFFQQMVCGQDVAWRRVKSKAGDTPTYISPLVKPPLQFSSNLPRR